MNHISGAKVGISFARLVQLQGSLHWGDLKRYKMAYGLRALSSGEPLSDDYHIFGVEWTFNEIRWWVGIVL